MVIPGTDEECCTVGDLIAHLKQFPADMPVVYQCFSDWQPLTLDEVKQSKADPDATGFAALVVRGGRIASRYPHDVWPPGEEPVPIVAVTFPGN